MTSQTTFECPRVWARSGLVAHIRGISRQISQAEFQETLSDDGVKPRGFFWAGTSADDEPHSGIVYVRFATRSDLEGCLSLDNVILCGHRLQIDAVYKPDDQAQSACWLPARPANAVFSKDTASTSTSGIEPTHPKPTTAASNPAARDSAQAVSQPTQAQPEQAASTSAVQQRDDADDTVPTAASVDPTVKAALAQLDALKLDKPPREWASPTPEDRKSAVKAYYSHLRKVEPLYKQAGTKTMFAFVPRSLGEGHELEEQLVARHFPSPGAINDHLRDEVLIWVQRDHVDFEQKYKMINLKDSSAEIKNGWSLLEPVPTVHQDDKDGKDMRKVERNNDCQTTDQPWKDIGDLYRTELDLLRFHEDPDFEPGDLFDKSVDNPAESVSLAPSFVPPSEMPVQASATSNGHVHKHRRPGAVGLGWGDYDRFADWQSHGRQITTDMVKPMDDEPSYLASYGEHKFDERELVASPDGIAFMPTSGQRPKTLLQKLLGNEALQAQKPRYTKPAPGQSSGNRPRRDYNPRRGDSSW